MNEMVSEIKTISKWRRNLWLAGLGLLVLALLTFLILLQSSQIWKLFQVDTASDTLTLYALTSLNFFALVIFAFIFLRSVVKLVRERKSLKLGARLKTRLLVYFVAVSLLPIAAMATFSYLFLNRALEKWFSRLPENVIAEARGIQQRSIGEQLSKFDEKAQLLGFLVQAEPNIDEQNLRSALEKGNLSALEIADPSGAVLAHLEQAVPAEQRRELKTIFEKIREPNDDKTLRDAIGFDAESLVLPDGRILRVVSNWRGETNISPEIMNSQGEFERLKMQQSEVRQLGFSTLSLLTFLLIFAASWVAFHLGRSLTQPIRALAEASTQVTQGNLTHRIDILAEDELGLLVESFNQMTAQLEENQHKLQERGNYIETVLQSLSTGVISLDAENRVTTINEAAISMFRLENAAAENSLLAEIVSTEDLVVLERLLIRARRLGHAAEQTVLLREQTSNNGEHGFSHHSANLPVALTATALERDSVSRKFSGAVLVIEDLTELLAAQRAAAWQEVAKRMAHEIKNPLTPIQLAAERIFKNFHRHSSENGNNLSVNGTGQLGKVVDQSTETILQEVSSLKAMVDEFSQFARLPHAQLEAGDLNEIVRQTALLYEDRLAGVRLETDLAADLPLAMMDAEQLRRVFVNLIENAIEAFDQQQEEQIILIKTWHDVRRGLIFAETSDNGRGIAATDFTKLFQPYFSTKGRGTGLGLAIVQRIIGEHGGRIRAASNLPRGAKFIVELPSINA